MEAEDILLPTKHDLFSAISVAVFRSQPIEIYRQHVRDCIKKLTSCQDVRCGTDDEMYWRKKSRSWTENLVFPWKELCQHHDRSDCLRQAKEPLSIQESTTPLQEFITILLDPSIFSRANVAEVVRILFEAILESPRRTVGTNRKDGTTTTRWTPSQLLFLRSIETIWNACPSLNHIFLSSCTPFLLESRKHQTAHNWNRLLSAAHYLATDCPRAYSTMIKFTLDILSRVAVMEHDFIQKTEKETSQHFPPGLTSMRQKFEHCPIVREPPRRQRLRLATLQDLHDRDISSHRYRPQHLLLTQTSKSGISLHEVLSCKVQREKCAHSSGQSKDSFCDDWSVVRTRAYKKFHALFRKPPSLTGAFEAATKGWTVSESCQFDLRALLHLVRHNYGSPCLRLCLLLVNCHGNSSVQCRRVCRMLWCNFGGSHDPIWLRIYCEIIVTWSCLDDRRACWDAIAPLVRYIEQIIGERKENEETKDMTGEWGRNRPVFQCLAHILWRRSRLLEMKKDEIRHSFRLFIKSLELYCGEMDIWLAPSQQKEMADSIGGEISTLQRLGILGLTSLNLDDVAEYATDSEEDACDNEWDAVESRDSPLVQWPFSACYDLRSVYNRLGKAGRAIFNDWDNLLSDPDFENEVEIESATDCQVYSGPPMANFIHDSDLLLQIFHFCGYQDLARCRSVCHGWKSTLDSSNEFWREVYLVEFPVHVSDPRSRSSNMDKENWKGLLVAKVLNERNLFHRRHQATGYKHRTCPYVGCSHVLKSQRLEDMHLSSHMIKGSTNKANSGTNLQRKRIKRRLQSGSDIENPERRGFPRTKKVRQALNLQQSKDEVVPMLVRPS